MCDREAPRGGFSGSSNWTCNCVTKPNVSYKDGTVYQIIGNFIIVGHRTQCTFKRMHTDVQTVDVDIRDVLHLSPDNIEMIWKTNSWSKLKKISSFT